MIGGPAAPRELSGTLYLFSNSESAIEYCAPVAITSSTSRSLLILALTTTRPFSNKKGTSSVASWTTVMAPHGTHRKAEMILTWTNLIMIIVLLSMHSEQL